MPYKLWPPGTRKGNKRWLARGSIDGRQFEKILEAKTRAAAEAEAERFIGILRAPAPGAVVTFEQNPPGEVAYVKENGAWYIDLTSLVSGGTGSDSSASG